MSEPNNDETQGCVSTPAGPLAVHQLHVAGVFHEGHAHQEADKGNNNWIRQAQQAAVLFGKGAGRLLGGPYTHGGGNERHEAAKYPITNMIRHR
nr:hypothetical protein [Tanacetum cinerariifolium]